MISYHVWFCSHFAQPLDWCIWNDWNVNNTEQKSLQKKSILSMQDILTIAQKQKHSSEEVSASDRQSCNSRLGVSCKMHSTAAKCKRAEKPLQRQRCSNGYRRKIVLGTSITRLQVTNNCQSTSIKSGDWGGTPPQTNYYKSMSSALATH